MQLDVQLLSISGIDSKLGLTMVRPSLQSAPELLALDPLSVSKHTRYAAVFRFLASSDLDLPLTF